MLGLVLLVVVLATAVLVPINPSGGAGGDSNVDPAVQALARAIRSEVAGDDYPWPEDDPCIQHPTFRGGSETSYTIMAVALTKFFRIQDSRLWSFGTPCPSTTRPTFQCYTVAIW